MSFMLTLIPVSDMSLFHNVLRVT
ncbi:MAG: hypothetical protein QOG83_71, partial [Alphaproteobacteria bacterium]|nr:hypothetical protein [Alphaproteobacteria bacterium]